MILSENIKVLEVTQRNFIGVKGYSLYDYSFISKKYTFLAKVKDWYALFSGCFLTRRLLRAEINNLYTLPNNERLVIAKKGIYKLSNKNADFYKVFTVPRGSKPLNICLSPNGHMFFGEYFQNMNKESVHVYGTFDYGETWQVVYKFPSGYINHIHGIFWDKYTNRMWILTGDRENECIIGWTDDEFKTLHEELRGGQEYRSCQLFFYKDFIAYATDSQYIENEIRKIDRKTLKITTLAKIQGSAIKGGQCGDISFLSTTVEPSEVNLEKASHVWVSKDGEHWKDVYKAEKDCWPAILQYGTIEFPNYKEINDELFFSGRAVKGLDGKTTSVKL